MYKKCFVVEFDVHRNIRNMKKTRTYMNIKYREHLFMKIYINQTDFSQILGAPGIGSIRFT